VAEFSFFDPDKEKYFTVKSQPVAVEAAADQAASSVAAAPAATPKPTATPAQNQNGAWLVHETARSWQPVVKWPGFWILNAAAGVVLIGAIAALGIRRSRQSPAGYRAAQMRERDRLVGELGRAGLSDEAFYAKALEALALQASLSGEPGPFELVRSLEAQGRNVSDLHAVLAQADEIKFSGGGGNAATRLDAADRRRIVRGILEVCR
jgi:hypothetical protein